MAHGIEETISGSPVTALSQLTRAATLLESAGSTPLLPDTPAALAALVAMHAGKFGAAHSVLRRATSAGLGGKAAATRHTLLLAFLATMRGHTRDAHALLGSAGVGRRPLEPRDELFAAAAAMGLARREGDLAALRRGWSRTWRRCSATRSTCTCCCHLASWRSPAARLQEQWWIEPHLHQAEVLLAGLGQPVCGGCHCTGTACTPRSPANHRRRPGGTCPRWLNWRRPARTPPCSLGPPHAGCGCWPHSGRGCRRRNRAPACRGGLRRGGCPAGGPGCDPRHRPQSNDDPAGMCPPGAARQFRASGHPAPVAVREPALPGGDPRRQAEVPPRSGGSPRPNGSQHPGVPPAAALSTREQEIARRVLTGLTYKEIDAQLFISAKTVEHHVAADPPTAGRDQPPRSYSGTCRSCSPRRMDRTNGGCSHRPGRACRIPSPLRTTVRAASAKARGRPDSR